MLTDRALYKDSIETSSLLWRESLKFDKATVTLPEPKNLPLSAPIWPGRRVSDPTPVTTTPAQRKESLAHFFQIKRNMPLHLIAGVRSVQLDYISHQNGSLLFNVTPVPGRTAVLN